jgi:hypothetical protein
MSVRGKKVPIVKVDFLDHVMSPGDESGLIQCTAIGYLVKQDKQSITICSWLSGTDLLDHDSEVYVLLKHKGMKITRLR